MIRRFLYLQLLSCFAISGVMLATSSDAEARTPRACLQAAKTAKLLIRKSRELKAVAAKMDRAIKPGGKLHKLHKAARKLQKPIVEKYASHFKQNSFLVKWRTYKLRRRHVLQSFRKLFFHFKLDWKKLRKGGYKNFNKIKSKGFKLPKKAALPLRDRHAAPCGQDIDADQQDNMPNSCAKANAKKKLSGAAKYAKNMKTKAWKKLSSYFTSAKLKNIDKIRMFLKMFTKQTIQNSINKTKLSINEGRRLRRVRSKFRRLKREVKTLKRTLRVLINKCRRSKRRRTSIDRSAVRTRKCGDDPSQTNNSVCWVCFSYGSAVGAADASLANPLVGSFEGNFQTANDWTETDSAYNSGAESAAQANNLPGL